MLVAIALVFAFFAFIAFAGSRPGFRAPLLRTGLVLVSLLYGVHGLFLAPELAARLTHRPSVAPSNMVVDAVFLLMALPYVIGTALAWPQLGRRSRRGA
jgi:hypothetical protein